MRTNVYEDDEYRPYRQVAGWQPEDEHEYEILDETDHRGVLWAFYCVTCGYQEDGPTEREAYRRAEAHVAWEAGCAISDRWKQGAKTPLQIEEDEAIESIRRTVRGE